MSGVGLVWDTIPTDRKSRGSLDLTMSRVVIVVRDIENYRKIYRKRRKHVLALDKIEFCSYSIGKG